LIPTEQTQMYDKTCYLELELEVVTSRGDTSDVTKKNSSFHTRDVDRSETLTLHKALFTVYRDVRYDVRRVM